MKISLNWIKQFVDFELPPVDTLVERIGAQLGAVEEVETLLGDREHRRHRAQPDHRARAAPADPGAAGRQSHPHR